MFNSANTANDVHHAVVHLYGILLRSRLASEVSDLDVAAKANNLIAYRMLESQDYKYRHYHYSQAYGHASGGYGDGWTGDFFLSPWFW